MTKEECEKALLLAHQRIDRLRESLRRAVAAMGPSGIPPLLPALLVLMKEDCDPIPFAKFQGGFETDLSTKGHLPDGAWVLEPTERRFGHLEPSFTYREPTSLELGLFVGETLNGWEAT
jgi:hypothetical protein